MKISNIESVDYYCTDFGILSFHCVTFNFRFKKYYIILDKKILHIYSYYKSACDKFNYLLRLYG